MDVTGDHDKSRFRVVETSLNVIGVRDNGRRIGNSEFLGIPRKRFTAKRKRTQTTAGQRSGTKNGVFKMGERACLHIENPVIREKLMKQEKELL